MKLTKSTRNNIKEYAATSKATKYSLSYHKDKREIRFAFPEKSDADEPKKLFEEKLKAEGWGIGSVKRTEKRGFGYAIHYFNEKYELSYSGYFTEAKRTMFTLLSNEFKELKKLLK